MRRLTREKIDEEFRVSATATGAGTGTGVVGVLSTVLSA